MAKVTVHHDRLTRYSSIGMMLLGLFTLLFVSGLIGIILIVVGYVMFRYYRRQAKGSQAALEASASPSPALVKEKEIHVVVRVPCKHCGVLNDQLRTKCESCGAPLK